MGPAQVLATLLLAVVGAALLRAYWPALRALNTKVDEWALGRPVRRTAVAASVAFAIGALFAWVDPGHGGALFVATRFALIVTIGNVVGRWMRRRRPRPA